MVRAREAIDGLIHVAASGALRGTAPVAPPGCGHMDKSINYLPTGNTNRISTIASLSTSVWSTFGVPDTLNPGCRVFENPTHTAFFLETLQNVTNPHAVRECFSADTPITPINSCRKCCVFWKTRKNALSRTVIQKLLIITAFF